MNLVWIGENEKGSSLRILSERAHCGCWATASLAITPSARVFCSLVNLLNCFWAGKHKKAHRSELLSLGFDVLQCSTYEQSRAALIYKRSTEGSYTPSCGRRIRRRYGLHLARTCGRAASWRGTLLLRGC